MRGKGFVKLHKALSLICRLEGATAEELAGELEVDRRSAYRILKTLESIGVPIFDEKEEYGKTVRKKVDEAFRKKFNSTSLLP